jgi:hypothetical protein
VGAVLTTDRLPPGRSVMKNRGTRHDWRVTGGYDPALGDGDDPAWGRVAIECRQCGETGRVWRGVSLAYDPVAYGCRRPGPDTWEPGDLLVRDGRYLDQFVRWLPGGLVRTYNAGGRYHVTDPCYLKPY